MVIPPATRESGSSGKDSRTKNLSKLTKLIVYLHQPALLVDSKKHFLRFLRLKKAIDMNF
jgi:hypothetical protein